MLTTKTYQCQTCFQNNQVKIELSFCSESIDLIEDCYICCNPNTISYTIEDQKIKYFEVIKTY